MTGKKLPTRQKKNLNKGEKMERKIHINNILMYVLIWFTIFTSALNYTYLPAQFSYIKDIIIFYLTFILIKKKIEKKQLNKPKEIGKAFYILFFIICIISWLGLIYGTNNSSYTVVVRIFRYLEFFLLFFIFSNLEIICTVKYKSLIKCYIILSIVLIFVHLFGYFVPNNIVSIYIDNKIGNGYYRNRISIGQPPIAVYPMIISYFYLLIYKENSIKTVISIVLLLIGVAISISTTGVLSIILTTAIILIPLILKKKNVKKIICVATSLLLIIALGIIIIKNIPSLNNIYIKQTELLNIRISSILKNDNTDLSMEIRDEKYNMAKQNMDAVIKKIFGLGMLGYNGNEVNVGSLENMYRTMYVCYGVIGITIFIIFIGKHIILNLKNLKSYDGIFLLSIFIVFAMHCYTLEVLYLPTISYTLPLFYCYVRDKESKEEKINENINS